MRNEPDISTNTQVQINQLIFAYYGMHAINYFTPLGIFTCWGRRMQKNQNHWISIVRKKMKIITLETGYNK